MSERALDLACSLISDRGPRLGELWTDFQHDDAKAVLVPGDEDPRQHWLSRPKGGSKDTDTAAMGLGWLIEDAGELDEAYVIGADEDQGNRLLTRARGLVSRSGLSDVVKVEATSIVNPNNGARVWALPADEHGGEGILSPLIIVLELSNWGTSATPRAMWDVAFSSIPKWPGMTFVVLGHAGSPSHWSHKVWKHAQSSPRWNVSHIPGPLPWVGEDDLAEQRELLLPSQFARRHMNVWQEAEDHLAAADDLAECVVLDGDLEPVPGTRYAITVDIGLKRDRTAVAVTHAKPRPADAEGGAAFSTVLDKLAVWSGTRRNPVSLDDVEAWIARASAEYNGARVVADPYQAAQLLERLGKRGIKADEFTFSASSVGRLGHRLYSATRDRALELPDDPDLLDELANVRIKETSPGTYRLDHDAGEHDDRAVTLALAVHHWHERQSATPSYTADDLQAYPIMKSGEDVTFQRETGVDSWRWRS